MPSDIPNPGSEPNWVWATRVTAQAARAAMAKGRTPQERFEIYHRLVLAACEEPQRRQSPEHSGSISEATALALDNLSYDYIDVEAIINISGFEESRTK